MKKDLLIIPLLALPFAGAFYSFHSMRMDYVAQLDAVKAELDESLASREDLVNIVLDSQADTRACLAQIDRLLVYVKAREVDQ